MVGDDVQSWIGFNEFSHGGDWWRRRRGCARIQWQPAGEQAGATAENQSGRSLKPKAGLR